MSKHMYERFAALTLVAVLAGCSSKNSPAPAPTPTPTPAPPPAPAAVIAGLATTTTIGSTVDVGTGLGSGDANPYGLAIAPITAGGVTAGDLIVCNYNDSKGNAGAGTTIEDLKPVAGSKPVRVAQDAALAGCNALAINPGGPIWVAAYTANDNPIYVPSKDNMSYTMATTLANAYMWNKPWGQVFGSPTVAAGATAPAAFYISNAGDGSIVQANITANGLVFTPIITGFPHSIDAKYGILAPAGLTYDPSSDTLYVVSSNTNSVLAFKAVSTIPKNGVVITVASVTSTSGYSSVTSAAYSFTGTASAQAKVVFSGAPLSYPISSALLYNGDLVVGNTGDNNLVEIQPSSGTVLGTKTVDTGAAGAIFGIATSGTTQATQKVYYNNDNANSVVSISQ